MTNNEILIRKAIDTIETQREEITYLNDMVGILKSVPDGEYERKKQYLFLALEESPIIQQVIEDMDSSITPDNIKLKQIKLGITRKPRYTVYKDRVGITKEEF